MQHALRRLQQACAKANETSPILHCYGCPHQSQEVETPRFLIRAHGITRYATHIPNSDGESLCKLKLNLSLWQIDECLLTPALVCIRCITMQTKRARKTPVTFWCEHGSHEVTEEHGPGQPPRSCAEHSAEAQRAVTRARLKANRERTHGPGLG